MEKEILIVTTNEEKENILLNINKEKKLHQMKFMTLEEFKKNYFFDIKLEAYPYLMEKYNLKYTIIKEYLNYLYVIDEKKEYKSSKLKLLQQIKNGLIKEDLLIYDPSFKIYCKTKKIIVKNYDSLELYEEEMFKSVDASINTLEEHDITSTVYECTSLEDEILFVIDKIITLIKKGIPLSHIFIAGVDDDYLFLLKRIFNFFNIPINLSMKNSIYGTKIVSNYLKDETLDLSKSDSVTKMLVNIINRLVSIKMYKSYKEILIEVLKKSYCKEEVYTNAVNIVDITKRTFTSADYVFVMNFNLNILPRTYKDEDIISDILKEEVLLYDTNYKNKRSYKNAYNILSNIPNLYLSYKLSSNFNTYYPSNLISDYNLKVESYSPNLYAYSDLYNKLILGEKLDNYLKFGTKDSVLSELYSHYSNINYNTYKNNFSGINKDLYLEHLPYPLTLSYTSINSYYTCPFQYYIKNVLKLDVFEDSFALLIGNLFHFVLEQRKKENFDFDYSVSHFLKDKELSSKEKFFLKYLLEVLKSDLEIMAKQERLTNYQDNLLEQEVIIPLSRDIEVNFKGKIDKIMYTKKLGDTYYSLIDYKTGSIDPNIYNMKYGLHMQLPIYLYLMSKGSVFSNPIFTGFYYQTLIPPRINYKKGINIEKEKHNSLKLQGYSTDNLDILQEFDKSYEDSDLIRGMKISSNGFYRYTKVLNDEESLNIVNYVDKKINEAKEKIVNAEFKIEPKIMEQNNISCMFCKYHDLCFKTPKDYKYLDKVVDFSFLEGEV